MIDFRKARFEKSASTISERPQGLNKEIIFIGRSNVGKSSLLNAICDNRSLAFTSSKPGHTRLLNYFSLGDGNYFVDAPGYGYSAAGKHHTLAFGDMMESYFDNNNFLKGVVFLLDSRREVNEEDLDFIHYLASLKIPMVIVFTKCDKLNQKEQAALKKHLKEAFPSYLLDQLLYVSIKKRDTLEKLKKVLGQLFN